MTKQLKIGFLALFLFQVVVAACFELAHDEAYYWLYSKNLDWGYFDHPPFVAIVIKIFSVLFHHELAVRFGFIILQFASIYILMGLTGFSWTSFLLFFSFPLASFTGLLALPDIPLLFMTAVYCYQLKKYLEDDSVFRSMSLGLTIALLFYAKYHGVLLVFFTLLAIPKLALRKSFYIVAISSLILFIPHLWWQYSHEFASLRYHFIDRPSAAFSAKRSLEFIGLQIVLAGVFAGPVVWWTIVKGRSNNLFDRAMKFISIGTVLFFLFSSFSKKVEANWTIFLAIPMIYLSVKNQIWEKSWSKKLLIVSFGIVVVTRILFLFSPETVKMKRLKEFHGWKSWAQEVQSKCGELPILANTYQVASKLSFYLNQEIGALNYNSRKNQFDFWRFDKDIPTKDVCYITDKVEFQGESLLTPEGKTVLIIKNQPLSTLWELKYKETK